MQAGVCMAYIVLLDNVIKVAYKQNLTFVSLSSDDLVILLLRKFIVRSGGGGVQVLGDPRGAAYVGGGLHP